MTNCSRITTCVAAAALAFCWLMTPISRAGSQSAVSVIPMATLAVNDGQAAAGDNHAFLGNRGCKKCHIKHSRSWKSKSHASAFDVLKPGERAEAKSKAGLDAGKDYTTDKVCLACHTTGFGKAGGYETPDLADKKSVRKAKKLQGVGCEMCHGAGEKYVQTFSEIQKSKRQYKAQELHAQGLIKISEATCTVCHNEASPTFKPFDYEARVKDGVHDHEPLKQRTE